MKDFLFFVNKILFNFLYIFRCTKIEMCNSENVLSLVVQFDNIVRHYEERIRADKHIEDGKFYAFWNDTV